MRFRDNNGVPQSQPCVDTLVYQSINQSMYYIKSSLTIKTVSKHFWIITSIH